MNFKLKTILFVLLGVVTVLFTTACGGEATPYETNNADNYTVSVRYDANGGVFTTNTSIIVDSYNISDLEKNSQGKAEIALLSPDNSARGNDAFTAINNGYFLAGWYEVRNESTDNEGNTVYTYSGKWDFEKDLLEVDSNRVYSSEQPVLTLYAAWVPLFEIEFYSIDTGEQIGTYTFDPNEVKEISVPAWDENTGAIEMYNFPEKSGYTFSKAYYDAAGTQPLDTGLVNHTGVVDYESGTANNSITKLYVEWTEGEWYHIYNAEQLVDNASLNGNYEIYADLDFENEIWPTAFMYGNFSGKINGNGHTIKNIELVQTNNSKVNAGLFGYLTETAELADMTFENVSFTIQKGTRVVGTCYGLLAGTISKDSELENVEILDSILQIDSSCYFGADDYSIGLICGMGHPEKVETAEIQCVAAGDNPESLNITVSGNEVSVEFISE